MATRKKQEERELTRKETSRRRRDAERNRRLLIGLIGVSALLLIIIGAGIVQELVVKPRQPIAVVEGVRIPSNEFARRVRFAWFQSNEPPTDPQGSSLQVLDQMVDEELLRKQAAEKGISVSDDEVTEAIEKTFGYQRVPPTPAPTPTLAATPTPGGEPTATPLPTPTPLSLTAFQDLYRNYLDRLGTATSLTEADFRSLVKADLIRKKLYDAVTGEVPTTTEQVHARHILVRIREPLPTPTPVPTDQPTPTPDPNATPTPEPRDEAQALARIQEVKQKLEAGGDFAALAQEYSDDVGSAASGGDLDWFGKGRMVPEFEEATFSLEPGQVSEPIKTTYGYHLIKVEEKDPARPKDEFALAQDKYEAYNTWLTDLRNNAQVERFWSLDKVPPTPNAASR